MEWISYHLFYQDHTLHDTLITKYIYPIVKELYENENIYNFFFIRYWQNGRHLRLRFQVNTEHKEKLLEEISETLTIIFKMMPSKYAEIPEDEYLEIKGKQGVISNDDQQYNNQLLEYDYIPEIGRYGANTIFKVEEIFGLYSKIIMDVIKHFKPTRKEKILLSTIITLVTLSSIFDQKRNFLAFLKGYMLYWESYFSSNSQIEYKTVTNKNIDLSKKSKKNIENLRVYYEGKYDCELALIKRKISAIHNKAEKSFFYKSILVGLIHMNNNRLGLGIKDEIISSLYIQGFLRVNR